MGTERAKNSRVARLAGSYMAAKSLYLFVATALTRLTVGCLIQPLRALWLPVRLRQNITTSDLAIWHELREARSLSFVLHGSAILVIR